MDERGNTRHVQTGSTSRNRYRESSGTGVVRLVVLALLCALLPPAGLLFLWRSRHVTTASRASLSLFAVLTMTVVLCIWMSGAEEAEILPVPVAPTSLAAATPAPAPVMTSGSSYPSIAAAPTDAGTVEPTSEAPQYVYSSSADPAVYHLNAYCDGKQNERTLTLEEALAANLQLCEKCREN